ncbi:MAG: hypothetical protein GWN87_32025 [Desulfuromonadales bacterium]|nr:hypothetical protein [Desulfuromonadales bacterium]NIS44143.1 hypothetical protein [Desulfuromonadales bacterium]
MSEEKNRENIDEETSEEETGSTSRFPEMDELQGEIARRIRDNQKFLDNFMDKDYVEEDDEEDDDDEDIFEEL